MPTYIYEILDSKGDGTGRTFEIVRSMKEPPLTAHPETGEPVRLVITPPYIPGPSSDHTARRTANDDKRLGELGFTKYKRAGDGVYEKRAGKGPDIISA